MISLSVTVITKNEAHNIADCLRSVQFATEIVVLDSGSTDQTVNIASDFGAKCSVRSDWAGFGIQKNRALVAANEEWILSLDADERVTPQLQAEILSVLEKPLFDAYSIPRSSSFCGQYIRHSGWSPDRVVRLFRRGCAVFSDDLVHERVVTSSRIGRLTSPMLHESYLDLEAVMNKANRYSSDGAQLLLRKGKKGSVGSALLHGFWAFIRTYLLRLGFLDGQMGLVLALYIAQSTYYRYLKLWLLQRKLLD